MRAATRLHGRLTAARQESTERIELLLSTLVGKNGASDRIGLRTADGIEFIPLQDIIRCEAENCYTVFYLAGGEKVVVSRTLKDFEESLSAHGFLRVHNSHLVNTVHIRRYMRSDGGYLVMRDGSHIVLSRRNRDTLVRAIVETLEARALR